ncbi:uncharacterized protein METZ01_LOCUS420920, partial [marine metagenome]
MEVNSNHINLAFDKEINNSKTWFQDKVLDVCGHTSKILVERLMQRLVEIFLYPYFLKVSSLSEEPQDCFPATGIKINDRCASLEIGTGRVAINTRQFLRHLVDFLLRWAFCFFGILFPKGSNKTSTPAVLVFGVGDEAIFFDSNDDRFVNYCRSGPIDPLRNGKKFFIEASSGHVSSVPSNFEYSKYPLIQLLRKTTIGVFGRFKILIKHIKLFWEYLVAVVRLPQLSLLGKDFAYNGIISELDEQGV